MAAQPSTPRQPVEPDSKTAHDLMPLLPVTAQVCDGHLCIGGVDTVALAREAGTALYVMDEQTVRSQLQDYVKWTQYHWKDVDVVYAGKAFMSVAMVKIVAEEGCCLDVSSGGELAFALRAGFPMERIYVHGNNKTPQELAECLDAGVGRIVVDSFEEMDRLSAMAAERGVEQPILIRVTPGIHADTHTYIQTGAEDSKFGFGMNEGLAMQAIERAIALPGLDFEGLHMHIGSQIFALHSFSAAIDRMVAFMREIRERTGVAVRMLDTGGGLGIKYGLPDEPLDDPGLRQGHRRRHQRGMREARPDRAAHGRRAGALDRRQRGRHALHRGRHQGDPEHPHLRRRRRRHVRQHPHVALRRALRGAHREQGRPAPRDGGDGGR